MVSNEFETKMVCPLKIFPALVAYSSIFVCDSSLLFMTKNRAAILFLHYVSTYIIVCAYMANKGELFSAAVVAHHYAFTNYVGSFIIWLFYYLLICAAIFL